MSNDTFLQAEINQVKEVQAGLIAAISALPGAKELDEEVARAILEKLFSSGSDVAPLSQVAPAMSVVQKIKQQAREQGLRAATR